MATPRSGGSRFKVEPDPPIEGSPLKGTYLGPADEIEIQVDGQPPIKIKPDAEGRFRIDPVPPGREIVFSDNRGLPGYLHRNIINLN